MEIEIETTADGSPTLYRPDIDEHYHSINGALAESLHIYLDLGWQFKAANLLASLRQPQEERLATTDGIQTGSEIKVFEVGFGTGLNAALTAQKAALEMIPTIYYSIELFPLKSKIYETLAKAVDPDLRDEFLKVNTVGWNMEEDINPWFTMKKIHGDMLKTPLGIAPDVVYYDAFAPEKEPEMWQPGIFEKLYTGMQPGGILTTYCAKGAIRRMMEQIGFRVERLPGPPGGKREVLRATKL